MKYKLLQTKVDELQPTSASKLNADVSDKKILCEEASKEEDKSLSIGDDEKCFSRGYN